MGTPEVEMEVTRMGPGISGKGAPREGHSFLFTGHDRAHMSHFGTHPSGAFFTSQIINWGTQYRGIRFLAALIYCGFDV